MAFQDAEEDFKFVLLRNRIGWSSATTARHSRL